MSAIVLARRARSLLLATVAVSAMLWAFSGFFAAIIVLALTDLITPLAYGVRAAGMWLAAFAALALAMVVLWRGRYARDLTRVALFLEERVPALSYALVTAVDAPASRAAPSLERFVDGVETRSALRKPAIRAVSIPAALLVVALLALAALPVTTRARVLSPHLDDVLDVGGPLGPAASRLSPIVVRITPPAYAGSGTREEADPPAISALAGSRIEVQGRGARSAATDSLRAVIQGRALEPVIAGDRWSIALPLPVEPAALRLIDRGHERLLALEPMPDLAPVVTLLSPANDTTYATPVGTIALAATAVDDIGLADASFEVLHTSGTGERFQTGRRTVGAVALGRTRTARITGTLRLDTMRLGPGDILHIRALASDRNDRTGPGRGASDTRTIRMRDPRQRDTVSIQLALEIPLDTSVLSQRALIIRAESLLRRERRLGPAGFRAAAVDLGARQRLLRERVEEVVEEIETESEDVRVGSTVVSRLLTQAASAMIDAENELGSGLVLPARPHMYRALRLLQQARDATARYYLRGPLPKVVLDLERARLRGRDSASPNARLPRAAADDGRRALLLRLDRAVGAATGAAAADSLTLLRLEALVHAPDAAEPLGRAAAARRAGRDAAEPLRTARRRIERRTEGASGLSPWQAAP